MTLKELQQMIKEELTSYMGEADDELDVDVDTEAGDVDATVAEKDPEETLRNIFDSLKDYFEGEEEAGEEVEDVEGEEVEDVEGAEGDEEADLEEAAGTGFGDAGSKKTSGANAGYTPAKSTKGDGKLHESKNPLQERFQKLANIIK